MIMILSWLSAFVALVTGLSMLGDIYLSARGRREMRTTVCIAVHQWSDGGVDRSLRRELHDMARLLLHGLALVMIVASSFICVVMPALSGELSTSPYEVLLRFFLTIYLAMQTPCPWWRYVLLGSKPVPGERHGD